LSGCGFPEKTLLREKTVLLDKLHYPPGAKTRRKIRGRGDRSGHGHTSCRGNKGALSRSGGGLRLGAEGGQMPLIRRLPKRGFRPIPKNYYQVVNLGDLAEIKDKETVTPEVMMEYGLVSRSNWPVKILGEGDIQRPITIKSHAFSASAKQKIEKSGGKIELIPQKKVK